ncbi:hypothetical protein TSUD_370960 [Trifolium subterraneum]|uniref:Uncharacterized protein n=1 Tax=Trifolium subterraneum TaxID=3900 RepID=A0A2Z6MLM7_TRISU|nr:hypothetical protein TSUD_370960 [Trifolium subterraneum]
MNFSPSTMNLSPSAASLKPPNSSLPPPRALLLQRTCLRLPPPSDYVAYTSEVHGSSSDSNTEVENEVVHWHNSDWYSYSIAPFDPTKKKKKKKTTVVDLDDDSVDKLAEKTEICQVDISNLIDESVSKNEDLDGSLNRRPPSLSQSLKASLLNPIPKSQEFYADYVGIDPYHFTFHMPSNYIYMLPAVVDPSALQRFSDRVVEGLALASVF